MVRGYWFSEEKWKARGLLAVVIALNFIAVGMLVMINDWYNEFYNALQAYAYELFWPLVGKFAVLAFLHIAVAVYAIYLRQMLQIKWRSWLTERYLSRWMAHRSYYKLETLAEGTDNPDQRISEDIGQFVDLTLSLFVGFLKQLTTLAAFAVVLWNLSGVLTVPVGSWEFQIYGYMLWFSLIYSILGTVGAHRVGKKLIGLNFEKQRFEADFRFSMMRVRENSESVAFYGGEAQEVQGFKERFARVIGNFWELMRQTKILNFYINGYAQLAIIVPLIMAAPRYFGGEMALGGLMQTISAFGRVQDALSYFVEAYGTIAEYAAVVRRLSGFTAHMEEVEAKESAVASEASPGGFAAEGIFVALPDGTELLRDCSFSLAAGGSLLVTGVSGAGKSTLLRTLAGLWPFARGRAAFPKGGRRLFLSQRPYLPLGTLARAVSYPLTAEGPRSEMERALRLVGMESFLARLDEEADWSHILSLGEQQRIAFARILLVRPAWVFLDEATSALDEAREKELYEMLARELPEMGRVSVGHRSTLVAYHERELRLDGAGGFSTRLLRAEPAAR
ncbi:ABC transporter ATP-binding protein/permease [uncultured Selenomonas sp.]|uniref:ABC transporter ATP-binding protein/permease n=1 Tax=uncultured Selenomonas sp. TaxID=159275 RepID=UPI0028DB1B3D|nr:ABC transporter ATP-binding protein/permease [uncultured Selenomonas sp.]